jgi:hypothetical protein
MGNIQRPIAFSLFVQLSISPSVQMGSKIDLKSDRARVKLSSDRSLANRSSIRSEDEVPPGIGKIHIAAGRLARCCRTTPRQAVRYTSYMPPDRRISAKPRSFFDFAVARFGAGTH